MHGTTSDGGRGAGAGAGNSSTNISVGKNRKVDEQEDEENSGDLGLQGFSSSSASAAFDDGGASALTPTLPRVDEGRAAMMRRSKAVEGVHSAGRESLSSISSSAYFSAADEGKEASSRGDESVVSQSVAAPASNEKSAPQTLSKGKSKEEVPQGETEVTGTRNSKSKGKRRKSSTTKLTKLREELAGPPSERPAAGTEGGPPLSPRSASALSKERELGEQARHDSNGGGDLAAFSAASTMAMPSMGMGGSSPVQLSAALPRSRQASTSSLGTDAASSSPGQGGKTSLTNKTRRPGAPNTQGGPDSPIPLMQPFSALGIADDEPPSPSTSKAQASTLLEVVTAPLSDEAALQRWVLSVGCVTFDLERGPELEFLYPSLGISREERDNIAFSSFPDTSIFDNGSCVFSWRVREVPLDPVEAAQSSSSASSSATMPPPSIPISPEETSPKTKTVPLDSVSTKKMLSEQSGGGHHRLWRSSGLREASSGQARSSAASSRSSSPLPSKGFATERQNSLGATSNSSVEGEKQTAYASSQPTQDDAVPLTVAVGAKRSSSQSSNYIYGYCFFRQKRDPSIRRGYFQKSVVILTHLPYVAFFSQIVSRLGPLYFEHGMPMLEAFCNDVRQWPSPEPGATLRLPLLGAFITVALPYGSQPQTSNAAESKLPPSTSAAGRPNSFLIARGSSRRASASRLDSSSLSNDDPIVASIPSTPLVETFREALGDLWVLWECMLLAEPILVVGPDPSTCSEAVWQLLDLIRPIPFAGDWRPFFTIHDFDFKTLITRNKPAAGTILGVTNPHMLMACSHWPHVLRVGRTQVRKGQSQHFGHHHSMSSAGKKGGIAAPAGGGGIAGGNSAGGGGPEHVAGFTSKRRRRISKDRPLLRRLTEMAEKRTDDVAANAMLRRYFSDLTERFLAPLNRYVSSLIPADFDLSSPTETPKIKPFSTTAFLASLKAHGTPLPMKSRNLPTGSSVRQSLYLDFIQCECFSSND